MPTKAGSANVATMLSAQAANRPDATAVICALPQGTGQPRTYVYHSFRELDDDSDHLVAGLRSIGVTPGMRLALLVKPSFDFISLVFALLKSGAVQILIDPGMGRRNLLKCLDDVEPEGFIAIPAVQAVRTLLASRYRQARLNVTVGSRWFWGGPTLHELRSIGKQQPRTVPAEVTSDDPAAIIFTTGSTGPPKGVLYRQGNFAGQVRQIQEFYEVQPGEVNLACFPLFGLFNCAMGATTVIPDMDASRPAQVDPASIVEAVETCRVTQSFGSPAVWKKVGAYCRQNRVRMSTLRQVYSAGAPVPSAVLELMKDCIAVDGDVHMPYGATEALPIASIAASEVLAETRHQTDLGAGVCVGRRFSGIDWKVIQIVDGPIATLAESHELEHEIGELIVRGEVVTREYVNRPQANALAKIVDGDTIWHRMGDVGYLDEQDRFWFCGRMAHRVITEQGTLFTIPCEAIFNRIDRVARSALVGVGPPGRQQPVMILEPKEGKLLRSRSNVASLLNEARQIAASHATTLRIERFLLHPDFPVDIRHNAKIFREKLAIWAEKQPVC